MKFSVSLKELRLGHGPFKRLPTLLAKAPSIQETDITNKAPSVAAKEKAKMVEKAKVKEKEEMVKGKLSVMSSGTKAPAAEVIPVLSVTPLRIPEEPTPVP